MAALENRALWLRRPGTDFVTGPAPVTRPGPGEVLVRVRAVSVNAVDRLPAPAYRLGLPWVDFPTVVGSDVAGEVVESGEGATRFRQGDRVLGMAVGLERDRNRAAEGAFQLYVLLVEQLMSPIPDDLSFEQACVLPMTLSTAATGLFQADHLGLALPSTGAPARRENVLVWGGSTSVGGNAIQLARGAGYRVIATASPRNFDHVRSLGAAVAIDRTSRGAVEEILTALDGHPLAGSYAIGSGSLPATMAVASRAPGTRRVASAQAAAAVRLQLLVRRRRGVAVSAIWGGTLRTNAVGPAIFVDYLPDALASGAYRAAPEASVVGDGLEQIPVALDRLRAGVSAQKLVVRI